MVTPCVGVWIETYFVTLTYDNANVTPCVGVWIETAFIIEARAWAMSHPAWVCGLKHISFSDRKRHQGHTLRGCVD